MRSVSPRPRVISLMPARNRPRDPRCRAPRAKQRIEQALLIVELSGLCFAGAIGSAAAVNKQNAIPMAALARLKLPFEEHSPRDLRRCAGKVR